MIVVPLVRTRSTASRLKTSGNSRRRLPSPGSRSSRVSRPHSKRPPNQGKIRLRIRIPARRGRRSPASHNRRLQRRTRHRIEDAFARLKDWRRIAPRHTRRSDLLLSAIRLAATAASGRRSVS